MSSAAVMPFKTKVSPPGIGKDETKTKAKQAKGKEVKNLITFSSIWIMKFDVVHMNSGEKQKIIY